MTLLVELTDKYSNQDYFRKYKPTATKDLPMLFSHQLFSFLYDYLSDDGRRIEDIVVIDPSDVLIRDSFSSVFSSYSPDLADYRGVTAIEDFFPEDEYFKDELLVSRIQDVIQNAKFISSKSLTHKEYICYVPLCGSILESKVYTKEITCSLFVSGEDSKFLHKKIHEIDQSDASLVSNYLASIKEQYEKISDASRSKAKNYGEPKFIQNFSDSYYEELGGIGFGGEEKKLHFFGSNDFVAKEGANHLFGQNNYFEHNLYRNVTDISNGDKKLVLFNFHKHFNETKQNLLSQIIQDKKMEKHVNIHGEYEEPIEFFSEGFQKINLPSEEEIQRKISGIFISLLKKQNKFMGLQRTLYPFVKHELLSKILSGKTNLKAYTKVIGQMGKIDKNDLNQNISFWGVFFVKYNEEFEKTNKIREDLISQNNEPEVYEIPTPKYQFIKGIGGGFKIVFNGKDVILPKYDYDGLVYIHNILSSGVDGRTVGKLYQLVVKDVDNSDKKLDQIEAGLKDKEDDTLQTDSKSIQKHDEKYILDLEDKLFRIEELKLTYELDYEKIEELEVEEKTIKSEIQKALNIKGKIRRGPTSDHIYYKKVSKSINLVVKKTEKSNPEFHEYLKTTIIYKNGNFVYEYHPIPEIDWLLEE